MTTSEDTGPLASARATLASLASDGRGWVLLTVAFGWFLGLGVRLAAPALVPYIRGDFGISLSTAGLLLSTLWVTYALSQLPGGLLGDRIGERSVLVGSMVLGVGALAAGAIAWSVLALFGAFVLLGVGTGIYATTRFTSLSDIYPERSATAIGISSAAGNVGTVLLPAGAGALAAAMTWRAGFAAVIPLFAVAAVGIWVAVPARTSGEESAVDELSVDTLRRVLRGVTDRRALVFTGAMFLMSYVYQGFTSFYPTYLVAMKGLEESTAAFVYSAFFAAGIVIQPLGGGVADAVGERLTMVGFAAVAAVALVALSMTSGFWALLVLSIVLSAQLAFWPVAQAAVIDALPTDMQGTGFGLLRTIYLLFAATSPAVMGALADNGFFDLAFLLLAGCAFSTVLLGVLVWDGSGREP